MPEPTRLRTTRDEPVPDVIKALERAKAGELRDVGMLTILQSSILKDAENSTIRVD